VYSATDATRRYVLQGTSCTCVDFERGQAPEGWCAHRIAAGLDKRVRQVLAQEPQGGSTPATPAQTAPVATSLQPLPEAPASVNVRLIVAGREVQLTLRDVDETVLLARLEAVLARYPLPAQQAPTAQPASPSQGEGKGWCSKHGVEMKLNHGKDGRSWYSHKTDQGWCKGR
jgi:hypothetical protein